uniref:TSA: Wollemia nobilis Ref_Wollemi_Transcript_25597_1948 transcribed RNA sequence n=1 Tax=Wollemia nobilis TaxID=56998 RepID=A0A0C9RGT4_9CONI
MPGTSMIGGAGIESIEPQSLKKLSLKSLKRTYDLFAALHGERRPTDPASKQIRIACKVRDEYEAVKNLSTSTQREVGSSGAAINAGETQQSSATSKVPGFQTDTSGDLPKDERTEIAIVAVPPQPQTGLGDGKAVPMAGAGSAISVIGASERYQPSAAIMKRLPSKWPRPVWHPPWKHYRVISGHLGWVRSIAFDPGNEWFCTGSADRTIKIWEVSTGKLKLTLTGHIEQVRGLAVSGRHPYMFSAGDDKQVKCWDLEYNKVIRSYHGHLSGVYCLALHPTLDILCTGGRDSVCRVWDIRTKAQIFALSGHENTVCSVFTQATDPQVVTGSHDTTIKLWDLAAGKSMSTLTFHKKSVRALAMHPFEHTFASASADNIKKFKLPKGEFLHNMLSHPKTIVNAMAINEDNVLVSAGDNGSLWFWDWKSGHNFQQAQTIVQPGSLDSEAGIYALSYDITGSRLITCEADKTIKMWKEDDTATPETHPINFKPPKEIRRF